MVGSVSLMLSALSSAGVAGIGDQYLALFLLGAFTRLGWVQPAGPVSFVGEFWFLAVVALAWAITTLPSLLPHSPLGTAINALSGPISLISGALFAWTSAGVVASVRPEFATAMYLLSRDAQWTRFDAYQATDIGILAGGAAMAGGLTFVKFLAKPGIALKTGTFGTVSSPMFAVAESGFTIVLVPLVAVLEHMNPVLLTILMGVAILALLTLLFFSVRWLMTAKRGIGQVFQLLNDKPRAGLAAISEFVLPGIGWISMGYYARGAIMLLVWLGLGMLALTIVGLLLVVPAYLIVARWSAVSLFRELSRKGLALLPVPAIVEPPAS